jgi:ribosomal-protein-alanine N-acetyltransferase
LKPTFWKKGYGSEADIQIKKFGIENNISNRFISIIHKENIDSINVAKKNNMIALYESNYLGMGVIVFGIENY